MRIPRSYCQQTFKNAFFNNKIKVICKKHKLTPIMGPVFSSNFKMELLGDSKEKLKNSNFTHVDMEHGRIRTADTSHRVLSLRAKADSVQSNQSQDQELKDSTRKEAISRLATILMDYIME